VWLRPLAGVRNPAHELTYASQQDALTDCIRAASMVANVLLTEEERFSTWLRLAARSVRARLDNTAAEDLRHRTSSKPKK
jgi:hypothetical protein